MNHKEFKTNKSKQNDWKRHFDENTEFGKEFHSIPSAANRILAAENAGGMMTKELVELGEEIVMNKYNKTGSTDPKQTVKPNTSKKQPSQK